ncbi:hypothetical protein HZB60_08255 [candidate division KSB1 bacterium]|nr:hypothetical protein [candidate division KSB1 bacterium]
MTTQANVEAKAREAVKLLSELQELDDELREIELERGDLPEEVVKLSAEIEGLELFISQRQSELSASAAELTTRTQTLAEAKDKQSKYQQQLYAVKTSREYDAITAEANFVKQEITTCEHAIDRETRRQNDLGRAIEERSAQLESVRQAERDKKSELESKLAETAGDENALLERRRGVVARLHGPLYAHYERIRVNKDGRGVARLLDGACGGCFAMIPPQIQQNVRLMNDIVMCETCGRYLAP